MGHIRAASLATSKRLQRVYDLLKNSSKPITTRQIMQKAHVCAVNSAISELRTNGVDVICTHKNRRWYYQLGEAQ